MQLGIKIINNKKTVVFDFTLRGQHHTKSREESLEKNTVIKLHSK